MENSREKIQTEKKAGTCGFWFSKISANEITYWKCSFFDRKCMPTPWVKDSDNADWTASWCRKTRAENQDDFKNILRYGNEVHKHGLDHSTVGGRLCRELIQEKDWPVTEFVSTVIYFHHGVGDCIIWKMDNDCSSIGMRKYWITNILKNNSFEIFNPEILDVYSEKAVQAYRALFKKINIFCKSFGKGYAMGIFLMGCIWE